MSFTERLRNEPALISGFLLALFNIFITDKELASSLTTVISASLPLVLAVFVRQNVDGPVTAKKKSKVIRGQCEPEN